MLLDNWISLDTWITFGTSILNINDTVGALRDTMIVRYGTMCNLRHVDKVADKTALSHLILNPFGVLMQFPMKRKSTMR